MRIITADETGLIKVVRLESGECLAVSSGEQARERAVRAICHSNDAARSGGSSSSHQADYCGSFHVARLEGAVETWDMSNAERAGNSGNACALRLRGTVADCPPGPVALACLPSASAGSSERSRILTCNAEGDVQVSCADFDGASDAPQAAKFSIRGPVSAAIIAGGRGAAGSAALAAGGKENDLKIWDVSTAQCTWKAKNVPHDFLDMRQPVWISSLRSLVPEGEATSGGGGCALHQIVAGTAHRQVRLYDARAQKRPTHSVDADEHGITTMVVAPGGREVVVADTAGLVRVLDLRKMKWGRRFEGPGGSVRGLAFHPSLPVLACVGLDRMARVYDYRSREQKFQVYLKQRLNAVLFDGEGEVRVAAGGTDAEGNSKAGASNGGSKGADWSGSEGWGSGEEYEMDESESESSEEEDGGAVAHGRRNGPAQGNGNKSAGGEDSEDGDSSSGGEGEGDSDDGDSSSGGEGEGDSDDGGMNEGNSSSGESDSSDDASDSEEEEAQAPPPKRQPVQSGGRSVKKRRR